MKNITELLARQKLDGLLKSYACCQCEKCRDEILARALSRLPAQYASTEEGELYARTKILNSQYEFEIMRELTLAIKQISEHPRHD